jgi:ornithine carbamoyltransferase
MAIPEGSEPEQRYVDWASSNGGRIMQTRSAEEAVAGADTVVTDCWVSMNQEHRARGHNVFLPYQVNKTLMGHAAPDALFMHCLPAHRGEEVTDEVIDGQNSVVFDEAENRLHAQKAVLAWCLGAA